jgi:hypothetical protein
LIIDELAAAGADSRALLQPGTSSTHAVATTAALLLNLHIVIERGLLPA